MESTWLVYISESANELYHELKPHIDETDSIFIIEAGKDRQGKLPEKAWDRCINPLEEEHGLVFGCDGIGKTS